MSEDAAKSRKLSVGDSVPVQFSRSDVEKLTLGGTFKTNQLIGDYLVDASKAKDFATQRNVAALVGIDDGADATAVRKELDSSLQQYPNVEVLDQSEFVGQAQDQVNQIVTIINILLGLSVLIALLGVINTLALSVIERTRELGLLRAVGLGRRQLRRMIRVESVLIALYGALLGIVIGLAFGVALVHALKDQGIDTFAVPYSRIGSVLIAAAIAGVLAAALPARRAARLNVLAAIAQE